MANDWFYTLDGRPAATPVAAAQLKQLAASGQLKPTDLVWQEGMLDWVPAGAIKGLFPSGKSLGDSAVVPPPSVRAAEGRRTGKPAVPFDWANMHPAAVFLLTIFSGGLFGLLYGYKIGQAYRSRAVARTTDAAGRTLGRVRHPIGVLVLSYLTLGIYFLFWTARALRECSAYSGNKDMNPRTELSLMLIFPPYAAYLAVFVLPELIRRAQALAGAPEAAALRPAVLFLNPFLFLVLPFLAAIEQEILNQVWLTSP